MMFVHFAVRNIRAYRNRSLVTILLLALTTTMLVFATAFTDGSHAKMLGNAVEIYPGYIQITHRNFRDKPSLDKLIFDTGAVRRVVAADLNSRLGPDYLAESWRTTMEGLYDGMTEQVIDNAIRSDSGDISIFTDGYRSDPGLHRLIANPAEFGAQADALHLRYPQTIKFRRNAKGFCGRERGAGLQPNPAPVLL